MVERPVSEQASGDVRLGADPGYGSEFGTAVHTLFASCIRHRPEPGIPSNERVRAVLSDEGASTGSGAVDRARAMVHGLLSSGLWQDLCAASEVYTEYPVSSVQTAADPPPSLVTGFIDVLYRGADGWRLADFKTDRVEDDRALEILSDAYRPQIEAYAASWKDATGEPIVAAGLWFADADTYVDVPVASRTADEVGRDANAG
jgi:ATP-dependent exoDNAse (exonuclease V) beta subunit